MPGAKGSLHATPNKIAGQIVRGLKGKKNKHAKRMHRRRVG